MLQVKHKFVKFLLKLAGARLELTLICVVKVKEVNVEDYACKVENNVVDVPVL